MKNVTFLLGAGASRNALPIAKEFRNSIDNFIQIFQQEEFQLSDEDKYMHEFETKYEIQQEFIENLKWMYNALEDHMNIDNFAKKLYIKSEYEKLKRLKATLSAYFELKQVKNPLDKRYNSFLSSILDPTTNHILKQLKILSWNYDYQIEKAYNGFVDSGKLYLAQKELKVVSKDTRNFIDSSECAIFKLNGSTSITDDHGSKYYKYEINLNKAFGLSLIDSVLRNYTVLTRISCFKPSLSFAWEKVEPDELNIVDKAINGVNETNILVVIGYSFPSFNKDIDKEIIGSMNKLEKVYLQSPDANDLKERFILIRPDIFENKLVPIFSVDQFYLPYEL